MSRNPESILQDEIRLAVSRDGRAVLWRNSSGLAEINGRKQRFGLGEGGGDLIGFLTNEAGTLAGRYLELEVKTPTGRQSPSQRCREQLVLSRGGFYALVRSVDEALAAIDRAARGDRS